MFKYISSKQNNVVFADVQDPETRLSFTTERNTLRNNAVEVPYTRTNTVLTTRDKIGDGNASGINYGYFPRTTRVVTSGASASREATIADLEFIVAELKARSEYFDGFLVSQVAQIVRPVSQ